MAIISGYCIALVCCTLVTICDHICYFTNLQCF